MIFRRAFATPFGLMQLGAVASGVLVEVSLPNRGPFEASSGNIPERPLAILESALRQFDDYFAGRRRDFDLPIEPCGTDFERRVWQRLRTIPYGETASYGRIAEEMGLVNGARAVGRANGANPIPIIIPCHRVIGGDGSLTGFGGGLDLKRSLLELEGVLPLSLDLS